MSSTRSSTAHPSRGAIPAAQRPAAATARRRREEQELCAFWRDWEFELLRPQLIVTVGLLALKRELGFTTLTPHIGETYERDGATIIPLPHPSGASGWLNDPANRERLDRAAALVRNSCIASTLKRDERTHRRDSRPLSPHALAAPYASSGRTSAVS